jgi:hypothetical protein
LAYVNQGGIRNGAHYVTAVWDRQRGMYTFYNVGEDGKDEFATIQEFLDKYSNGQLISVTQVF